MHTTTSAEPIPAPATGCRHGVLSLLRRVLLGAAAGWLLALPAAAELPTITPIAAERLTNGSGEALSISLRIGDAPYHVLLDERAGIASVTGGDEPEVGKRAPEVRALRTVARDGRLKLRLMVDGTPVEVPLGIAANPSRPVPARKAKRGPDPVIRSIQAGLAELGLDPGPVDGYSGRRTQRAVRRFEDRYGFALSASPTAADAELIELIAAAPSRPVAEPAALPAAPAPAPAAAATRTAPQQAEPTPPPAARLPTLAAAAPTAHPVPVPELDLAAYVQEPFAAESHRVVQALAARPESAPETLERMVGVLLARGRLDEAGALADDLARRHGDRPLLTVFRGAVAALTTGILPPGMAVAQPGTEAGRLWSAIAALSRGDLDQAVALGELERELAALPDVLRQTIAFKAVGRFVEAGRFAPAHDAMRMIESWTAEPEVMGTLAYWRARELDLKGERAAAATLYDGLTGRTDEIGMRARYRLAALRLDTAEPAAASAIADELQGLALNWMEPELDPAHERLVAVALRKSGRVVDALDHLAAWSERPGAGPQAAREETTALLDALIDGTTPASEPVRYATLSLIGRWTEEGEPGRARIARAAARLADAGLTARAEAMLREVESKAGGAEQVGLRLRRAELALAAGDGQRAWTILQAMAPSVPASSPHRQDWALLYARAAIAAGDPKAARQLLAGEKPAANDPSLRTALLGANLAAGDWNAVAELFRQEVPADPARAGARHDDPALQDAVLGLAAALSNAGRSEEAAALGETWGPVMDKAPEGLVFRALTRPTPLPIDELKGMAEQVAGHYGS